jgi:hypothetical protein
MKKSFFTKAFAATAGLFLIAGTTAYGQGMPGMDAAMMKMFGDNKNFTTDAELSMVATNGTQNLVIPMTISQLNGASRTDVDMEKAKGVMFPPETLQQLKTMGMTKVVNIVKPDAKLMMMMYTDMSSYLSVVLTQEQADALTKAPNMVTTKIGTETINGHPCVKNKVVLTGDAGQKQEFTLWTATDLNSFPMKLQSMTPQGTLTILYKNTKLEKPDAKLFDAPVGYTKYNTQEAFQEAIMKKMMGGAPAPK